MLEMEHFLKLSTEIVELRNLVQQQNRIIADFQNRNQPTPLDERIINLQFDIAELKATIASMKEEIKSLNNRIY